jgi:hypothetical protein
LYADLVTHPREPASETPSAPDPDHLGTARDALALARQAGMSAIDSAAEAQYAYDVATELMANARQLADDMARRRALAAARIRNEEALSLSGLANRLAMSKSRADQLMQLARGNERSTDG